MSQRDHEVRLLSIAEDDLADIITYIASENSSAAEVLLNKIESCLASLSKFPTLGQKAQDEPLAAIGYRYLVVDNYLIFYTVAKNVVLVHRIIHGARDYHKLL